MFESVLVIEALALLALVAFVVLFWLEMREAARTTKAPSSPPTASPLAQVLAMPRRPSAAPRILPPESPSREPS